MHTSNSEGEHPGGRGVDVGVCRQVAGRNVFDFAPLDGYRYSFLCLYLQGGPGGLVGCVWRPLGPTKESSPPLRVRGLGMRCKSPGGLGDVPIIGQESRASLDSEAWVFALPRGLILPSVSQC